VSLPAKGAKVELAMASDMPCFQAGGGAAAGVWAWADRAPKVNETTKPSCLNRCVEMYFTDVSNLFFKRRIYSIQFNVCQVAMRKHLTQCGYLNSYLGKPLNPKRIENSLAISPQ
jgi:hypothetical protein